jgi:hypothetical protein
MDARFLDERYLAYVYIERGPEMSLRLVDRAKKPNAPGRERRLSAWAGSRDAHGDQWLRFARQASLAIRRAQPLRWATT